MDQLFVLRSMLESYGAELAATKASAAQIERLDALAREIDTASQIRDEGHHSEFLALNNEFHRLILTAAHSERLEVMISGLVEIPVMLRTLDRYSDDELRRSCAHHHELVAAFRARA